MKVGLTNEMRKPTSFPPVLLANESERLKGLTGVNIPKLMIDYVIGAGRK